jgi:hypothetical protein
LALLLKNGLLHVPNTNMAKLKKNKPRECKKQAIYDRTSPVIELLPLKG